LHDFEDKRGPATQALADLGGKILPLSVPYDPTLSPRQRPISLGNLRLIDPADAILVWAPGDSERAAVLADPPWPLLPAVRAGHAVVSPNNVGAGSVYTVMECLRLWDQVYSTLS